MFLALVFAVLALALFPCALFLRNLRDFTPLPPPDSAKRTISVLIPARDEEANIAAALHAVLASRGVEIEVLVLDDGSTDRTAAVVREIAMTDPRIRLLPGAPLPAGWRGKNFACQQLAAHARHPLLVFLDADVRVSTPDALAGVARFMAENPAALASGIPRQLTRAWLEKLIVPLIHFVLLGFLPLRRMRATTDPRFAAACGQLLAVRREIYFRTGGHAAIADSIHDAVALARSFRAHGQCTDLFDATATFSCRMYSHTRDVWFGFAKNAHEGLGAPRLIVPATLLLLGGQVVPFLLLAAHPRRDLATALLALAVLAALLPRLVAASRFAQPRFAALLHPLSTTLLLAIQWHGLARHLARRPIAWRGRA